MKVLKNIITILFIICFCNIIPLFTLFKIPLAVKILLALILTGHFLFTLIHSEKIQSGNNKLRRINKGCQLVRNAGICAVFEIVVIAVYFNRYQQTVLNKIFSIVLPVVAIALMLLFGIVRITISSKQVKLSDYILLLLIWWMPVVNIFLFWKLYKTGRREFRFETDKLELENARAENAVCKTKYPVLLVHGIFFRDWQYFNYWGRVPAALIRNGAEIYYGNQQSASSIERSSSELRDRIIEIINETGAEKLNIIAHSKGGLDSRYAISCLGMDKYIASLTTINTPHDGCDMVDYLFERLPESLVNFITRKYNRIFTKLGDKSPDFISGANDLRSSRAVEFNKNTPDSPDIIYSSYMTIMSSWRSAFFPLSISYLLIKKLNGDNDGLVYAGSAKHGEFTLVKAPKRRGICHGDVIDLMRENIEGYDVREFYVGILKKLKEKGL